MIGLCPRKSKAGLVHKIKMGFRKYEHTLEIEGDCCYGSSLVLYFKDNMNMNPDNLISIYISPY